MGTLGLKNADVAQATGVTGPAVSLWRTAVNVPNNDRIGDLADILQVTPETILVKLGRMKPRAGITGEWEGLITRFQDAGPEAENLLFAIGDALLLAMSAHRTNTELVVSLDPLLNENGSGPLVSSTVGEDVVLFYDRIRLPDNHTARLVITCAPTEENSYTVVAASNDERLAEHSAYLIVGKARYDADAVMQDEQVEFVFDELMFSPTVGELRLVIE
jgi:transcriptional regulator with XRE-family HTH domain